MVPWSISCRFPATIQVSEVVDTIAETLLSSSIMERTVAQFGPTFVTMPTSPAPAMTLQSTWIPSFVPLSIVNVLYQLLLPLEITFAPTIS